MGQPPPPPPPATHPPPSHLKMKPPPTEKQLPLKNEAPIQEIIPRKKIIFAD